MHFAGGVWCRAASGEHAKEARVGASHGRLTGGLFVLTSLVLCYVTFRALCAARRHFLLLRFRQGKQTLQLSDRCNHYVDKDGTDANKLLPQMNGTDGEWKNKKDQRR